MSSTVLFPGNRKPMVNEADYELARRVLDVLPDGVYLKCSACHKWWRNSDIKYTFENGQPGYLCEECA